jgi:hypothetical protein
MKLSKLALVLLVSLSSTVLAQAPSPAPSEPANPFARFFGEWTLKNDDWSHNWGGKDESIKIPNHYTLCKPVNTATSVLCAVDTPPKGHILWAYNPAKKEVRHLSSFGELRIGVGQGTLNDKGDLRLKISFADEAPGTYRIYHYTWINENEYDMRSVQYDEKDKPTGLFYGGRFVRIAVTAR